MCRFEKAEELLRTTNLSIKEIANHTGILDCSHFVRDFAKSYGMSPKAYRRALRDVGTSSDVPTLNTLAAGRAANKSEVSPINNP
jgi:AraC-like DNA-binding protein